MTNPITILGFKSFLKVMKQQEATPQEIAEALVDTLGVYYASEIATEIQKAEETIPVK
jgi:hypothetical protein